jgi:hypothetical protein
MSENTRCLEKSGTLILRQIYTKPLTHFLAINIPAFRALTVPLLQVCLHPYLGVYYPMLPFALLISFLGLYCDVS